VATDYKKLDQAALDLKLLEAVKGDDLVVTAKLIASGASVRTVDPLTLQPLIHAAVEGGQVSQVEFLIQNGADPHGVDASGAKIDELARRLGKTEVLTCLRQTIFKPVPDQEEIDDEERNSYRCGFLHKTGENNRFWKRRWFVFDEDALRYYKLKGLKEPAGVIFLADMVSVSTKDDPNGGKPFYFELRTCLGRTFEFAADNEAQLLDWLDFLRVAIDSNILSNCKFFSLVPKENKQKTTQTTTTKL